MDEMLANAAKRSENTNNSLVGTSSTTVWGGDAMSPALIGGTITLTAADTAPVLEAGDSICAHSETLARHVTGIQEQLKAFADLLKEAASERASKQKEKEKDRSWEGFIWSVLYVGLKFIAKVMASCSKVTTGLKYGMFVNVILGEGSKLAGAAAELCREKGKSLASP